MGKCKKCGNQIPSFHIINETKIKVSVNRKYCFDCSPYKKHNTKKLEIEKISNECICESCGRKYFYKRNAGHTLVKCNSCQQSERRKKLKNLLIEHKGGKCSRCGYNKCIDALEFHHLNPEEKEIEISSSWNKSYEKLKNEADKCILICSNCHKEIHYELMKIKKNYDER